MQGQISKFAQRVAAIWVLAFMIAVSASARGPVLTDANGQPRSERGQWVYRIVAKWADHVQEAYRIDPRRWAESMSPAFARAPLPALRKAAAANSFSAMNDAVLAASPSASTPTASAGTKALGDPDRDLVYVPVAPCRILDTRIAGGPIVAGGVRNFDLADVVDFSTQGGDTGNCNVGNKGSFAAAAVHFTVVSPGIAGYITAFPYLGSRPNAATLNYAANDIRNGFTIVRLDQSAATNEFSVYSVAQTHLVADVVGYFTSAELPVSGLPDSYWATSNGDYSCGSICSPEGVAAATSTGMVCKAADGSSYKIEYRGNFFYECGGGSRRTAQCFCLKK